jgi:hypothetical protein
MSKLTAIKEPREFWITMSDPKADFSDAIVYTSKPEHGAIFGLSTHVIEYSAYEQALSSLNAEVKIREEFRAAFSDALTVIGQWYGYMKDYSCEGKPENMCDVKRGFHDPECAIARSMKAFLDKNDLSRE